MLQLPKINFSSLDPSITGTDEWAATRVLAMSAIESYGGFEAVYDNKIIMELENELFEKAMKELFGLPFERKVKNVSKMPYHGYIGNIPGRDFESLNVENVTEREGVDEFAGILWGDEGNPKFCDTIHAFSKHVSALEQMVRRMVLESLGLEHYFDRHVDSTMYALRLSKYGRIPKNNRNEENQSNNVAMEKHRDVTIISIVCQHGVEGLEVETKDGSWLSPSPYSFTVLIGEAFWAWSNGRTEPAWHRVIIAGDEMRYSAIFFAHPKDGCMVQAPEELVDGEHPLQFKPYEYGDYVRFCFSDVGLKTEDRLRAYCGMEKKLRKDEGNIVP